MGDPFRTAAIQERAVQVVGICLLIALGGGASYLLLRPDITEGQMVEARVLSVGTYAVSEGRGGDLPILIVRLPNGSTGQVRGSWAAVKDCRPGQSIKLLQRGAAVQIGVPGCKGPSS